MTARIRVATNQDRDDIRDVHLQAFSGDEGKLIADLAVKLLTEESDPATISLVAETHAKLVGHVAFSPVFSGVNNKCLGYILAPLAVTPQFQKTGVGSKLVSSGMERLEEQGVNVLFVYGDPRFYERFGFTAARAAKFSPPYNLKYPFGWQALVLREAGMNEHAVRLSCVAPLRDPALW